MKKTNIQKYEFTCIYQIANQKKDQFHRVVGKFIDELDARTQVESLRAKDNAKYGTNDPITNFFAFRTGRQIGGR